MCWPYTRPFLKIHWYKLHHSYSVGNEQHVPYIPKSGMQNDTVLSVEGDRAFIKHRTSGSEQITGSHHSTFSGYFLQE
jgi:hypothetical protein